jgi:glycyl-tRNA synthetase beta chain
LGKQFTINLHQLLQDISADFVAAYPDKISPVESLQEFFIQRIRTLLQEGSVVYNLPSVDYDLVNAVLGENDPEYTERALKDLLDVRDRALFLQEIRNNGKLDEIYETVNRSSRLATQKGRFGYATTRPYGCSRYKRCSKRLQSKLSMTPLLI